MELLKNVADVPNPSELLKSSFKGETDLIWIRGRM